MSALTCQSNPPKCKREDCNNLVSKLARKKDGRIWQTYCCPSCQVPKSKGVFQNLDAYKPDAPICANEACANPTSRKSRIGYGWNKYCCLTCQKTSSENIQRTKATNLLRYGNEIAARSNDIRLKTSLTVQKMWNNRTDDEKLKVFKKSIKSRFRLKEYKLPSGKLLEVMGNEHRALDELLIDYAESHIIAGNELNISISYIKPNGRPAKYYPDIYIPKDNLIIEVKSKWTYSGKPEWLETNLLKQQATIVAGYNFKFLIY